MIGQTVSHYRILEELGAGGMGVVYKAEDLKLERTVALKFLPPELTRDKDAKTRFIHEAQAASALQHHNICTIHEIDETEDGRVFISMDCYEGETLKDKITKGPLAVVEAIDIVTQVADGLAEAHEAGMVHRDIKPVNIMVTDKGVVKILDFGLAKLLGQTKVTKTGTTVGTVAYMSPEQAKGGEVDARSDVFSLGVVLYELLAGDPPFRGDHEAAVLYGVMHTPPDPLTNYRTDVSEDMQRIVETALRKDRGARYQNASDMTADLSRFRKGLIPTGYVGKSTNKVRRALAIAAALLVAVIAGYFGYVRFLSPTPQETSFVRSMIAVLPFENLGPPEDEHFADGLTEEISARLVNVGALGVIARKSAIQYKNTNKPVQQIGEELGVDFILEGTIRWQRKSSEPGRIRVTPQLVRVSDATQVWADIYDEAFTKVFEVQAVIATRVTEAMGITLLGEERQSLELTPTTNFEAYRLYLHGKDVSSWYSRTDMQRAEQMLEEAIQLDPEFVFAYAELANLHGAFVWYAHDQSEERVTKARKAAEMALQLAPESPEAHMAMGKYYHQCLRDWDRALVEFETVLKRQPNNADALTWIGFVQRRKGRWTESLENMKNAVKLSPLQQGWIADLGWTYSMLRRYSEAKLLYERAILLKPGNPFPHSNKVWDCLRQGKVTEAREVLHRALEHVDANHMIAQIMAVDLFDRRYDEILARLSLVDFETLSQANLVLPVAEFYELIGQSETARSYYDSSRVFLEHGLRENPDDSGLHSALGIAYAGLGRKEDAIAEGKRAVELTPISEEAVAGPNYVEDLARIYMMVGELDAAVDQLKLLLSIPSDLSVGLLKLDPRWDRLRDFPPFEKLLGQYSDGDS